MTATGALERQVPRPCGRRRLVMSVRVAEDTAVPEARAAMQPNFRRPLHFLCLSFLYCQMVKWTQQSYLP